MSAWETVLSWFKIPELPKAEFTPASGVRDVHVSEDGATITFLMHDGNHRALKNPYNVHMTGDPYGHIMIAISGALLSATERIEELEKRGEANG